MVREASALRPSAAAGGADALRVIRAVVARGRSEQAFRDFLAAPPPLPGVGMPVAAVPGVGSEPVVASVSAVDLLRQAEHADYPPGLPTQAADWAMAQAILDRGQRLDLGNGLVLWWWARGGGADRRVHVLELERGMLVWRVQQLAALSVDEAAQRYPELAKLL
jgi:hypothetical protein